MGVMLHEDRFGLSTLSVDLASVAANESAEQTFTLKGLKKGDFVGVNKPSANAGLGVVNARVSADDTLAVTLMNTTAGAIDASSETWTIFWFRAETTQDSVVNP